MLALATSGALLLALASNLTFVGDGWDLLAGRPDWTVGTFLDPFNEHPVLLTALSYKVLLNLFGMDSALPFFAVSISVSLLCATLLFVFMRRRVGGWLALAGTVLILFLGAAHEDLLWEFQVCFFGSMAAGLGALLALDREDGLGDAVACFLLVVSTAFSSLGIPFIVATIARVGLSPGPRFHRVYVPLLPTALYVVWWLSSGHSAGSELSLGDIPDLPRYVFDAAAAGIASLLGRQPLEADGRPPMLAQVLAILFAAVLVYRSTRQRRLAAGLLVALVLVFSFWGLLALDRGPQRFSSHFQYPSAIFLLIVAAEALRGQRIPRLAAVALAVISTAAVVGGLSLLDRGYSDVWKPTGEQIRATLAAVDIAGGNARPHYRIAFPPSIFLPVERYRDARRKHGTPAFSEAQLITAEESARKTADRTLAGVLGLRLNRSMSAHQVQRCRELASTEGTDAAAVLPPGGVFELENRMNKKVTIALGRFSHTAPIDLGAIPARADRLLRLPADNSIRAWHLSIQGGAGRLCVVTQA